MDRRFYPAEMSNERWARYNNNEMPRPMEVLDAALETTRAARARLSSSLGARAVLHWFKRDLRVRDKTALSMAGAAARVQNVGVIGL